MVELRGWSEALPAALARFPSVWNGFLDRVERWYGNSPAFLRSALDLLAEQLERDTPSLVGFVTSALGVGLGELAACCVLGLLLVVLLERTGLDRYFREL